MATTTTMTVTIAGITGKMGQLIAKYLLARSDVKVHGLCRTPSKLSASLTSNPRLSVFQSDANDTKGIHSALKGSDAAVCCYLGDVDVMIEGQKRLIDACISENVPRYVASDWSMDFRKLKLGDHPLKDPMKHVQAYLEEKEASNQIKAVHILNACFLEIPWGGLWNSQTHKLQYWGTGEEKWELTSYSNAAEYTAKVVVDPEASGWFSFCGDHKNIWGIAEDFETIYKQKPEVQKLGSLDDLCATMHKTRDAQPHNKWAWMSLFYSYYALNGQTTLPEPLDNARFPGVKLDTVRDYFARTPLERLGRW